MDYEQLAVRITKDFELFLMAINGLYLTVRAPGAEITPLAVTEFKRRAAHAAQTFETNANEQMGSFIAQLTIGASDGLAASFTDVLPSYAQTINGYAMQSVLSLEKQLKGGRTVAAHGINDPHGGIGKLLQERMQKTKFTLRDTAGRQCDASKLMRADTRQVAYQAFLERQVDELKGQGDLVRVSYPDPTHAYHLTELSMSDQIGYASLRKNWKTLFHHNSKATLVPHVQAK